MFSVPTGNPFMIFPLLQKIAREHNDENNIMDLSRGDPGYNFTPSQIGRQFFSYLIVLDSHLNHDQNRFVYYKKSELKKVLKEIENITKKTYRPNIAKTNLKNLDSFLKKTSEICQKQGLKYDAFDILYHTFKRCTVSGGCYHDPKGEEIIRAIVADWHQQTLTTKIDYNDVIFTSGASHAIGILFKILGKGGGYRYLRDNDVVLITSPVYSPYMNCLHRREVKTLSLAIDPISGDISKKSLEKLKNYPRDIPAFILIDPNNPTGFSLDDNKLKIFADLARKKNALVITDEVYSPFFPKKKTMMDLCPERVIRISARSKIERSTGLRFGEITIAKAGQKYISEQILQNHLPTGMDIMKAIIIGKGPGGTCGELQHTTFVPGPMQFLGAAHILFGQKERQSYRDQVSENRDIFYKILGLPHKNNAYYVIFDLNEIKGAKKATIPIEQKLIDLAKKGVVYLPAFNFFSDQDKQEKDRLNTVRACIVNATPAKIKKAAEITKEYLCN